MRTVKPQPKPRPQADPFSHVLIECLLLIGFALFYREQSFPLFCILVALLGTFARSYAALLIDIKGISIRGFLGDRVRDRVLCLAIGIGLCALLGRWEARAQNAPCLVFLALGLYTNLCVLFTLSRSSANLARRLPAGAVKI